VLAGVEWMGANHSQSHMHKLNVHLLNQVGAPQTVRDAWEKLEVLRVGNVYGARTNGTASAQASDLDPDFLESVGRDGVLLYQRDGFTRPAPLQSLEPFAQWRARVRASFSPRSYAVASYR
jgi:hypothetical protein